MGENVMCVCHHRSPFLFNTVTVCLGLWLLIPSPSTAGLNDGLAAYYPFNGNANNESGNENHGTEYGGIVLTADRFGNADRAFSFDKEWI